MGFMSPGLGFATTVGAAIGGAARQANADLNLQNQQDRENDVIWMQKFEKGLAEYNKDKKDTDNKTRMYGEFLNLAGNNTSLANTAMNRVLLDPKSYGDTVNWIHATVEANKNSPAFQNTGQQQSSFLDDMQSNLDAKRGNLQNIYQGAGPGAQKFMTLPNGNISGGNTTNASNEAGSAGWQPNAQPYTTQPNTAQPTGIQPSVSAPPSIPPAPGQQDSTLGSVPSGPPSTSANQQTAGNTYVPFGNSKQQITPYQQGVLQHQQNEEALAKSRLELDKQRKPQSPEDAANISIATDDAKRFLHDPKTGLQVRINQLPDYQSQLNDINGITSLLNTGLKADAVQPMYDELNRFTTATLGLDLSSVGISNSVPNVQLLKKEVANAMIDRLKTLHFGRITNYTESIVKQGLTSTSNDPDTNIKISLALKSVVDSAIQGTQLERQAAYDNAGGTPTIKSVADAHNAASTYTAKYLKDNAGAPWPQVQVDKNNINSIANMETGQWFEDAAKGKAGKMYRVLGADNGILQLQNANGTTVGIPIQ